MLHVVNSDARTITVTIASQSSQKIAAVKHAFDKRFPCDNVVYRSSKTCSNVPEQPVGYDVALQGVCNRVQSLPSQLTKADYVVSIENYIEQSPTTKRWYDKGLILVQQQSSSEIVLITKSVLIPDIYVQLAQQMSTEISELGYSTTVGTGLMKTAE